MSYWLIIRLWTYLADINEQAQDRLQIIINQMQKAESVTEKMKEDNQWELVFFFRKGILTATIKLVGKVVAAPFCLIEELRNRLVMFIVS